MLIEKRVEGNNSVFVLNSTEELFNTPERFEDYWQTNDWTFDSYGNAEYARRAMEHGLPNRTAMAAYAAARDKMSETIDAFRIKSIRRRRVYDETGDEACGDRYLLGDPRLWGQMRKASKNRCITVGLMLWMSCGNAEKDFAENVANGVALAEVLASAGYSVRVVAVQSAHINGKPRGFIHPLVEYGKPIDEHALMAWGQPAACRHIGFTWMRHLYQDGDMGQCRQTPDAWLKLAGIDIFLAKQWSENEQKQHIAKVLEKVAAQ